MAKLSHCAVCGVSLNDDTYNGPLLRHCSEEHAAEAYDEVHAHLEIPAMALQHNVTELIFPSYDQVTLAEVGVHFKVTYRGRNKWSVRSYWGDTWNGSGWEYEQRGSRMSEEYMETTRFSFDEAVEVANRWAFYQLGDRLGSTMEDD